MKEKIEIPISKNKLYLIVTSSLLFVIAGIWLFLNSNEFEKITTIKYLGNPILIKSIGIIGVLFFGATGKYGIRKMFDNKPGLIIDSTGITDNSNESSIGLIEWNDISEIKIHQVMSTKFLLINVVNPEKYIGKAKSRIRAKLMRTNMEMTGTPLSITSNTLKYNFGKLEQLVQTEFNRNKKVG